MIPLANITEWRGKAPWALDQQVEQDLAISRALVDLFSDPVVSATLAFRGGTALHKLYFDPPGRYSEDIDLVQVLPGPIGPTLTAIRGRLDSWLGKPKVEQNAGRVTLKYRFDAETQPVVNMRLKLEINTREHVSVMGIVPVPFAVRSPWFTSAAQIQTYRLEELLGTKLRALYQRRKGRDVFDLSLALERSPPPDSHDIVRCFLAYMGRDGNTVSRAEFERNLVAKRNNREFMSDIDAYLPIEAAKYDAALALDLVGTKLVALLPGKPWVRPAEPGP